MNKKTRWILVAVILVFILGMAFYPVVKRNYFTPEEIDSPKQIVKNQGKGKQDKSLNINVKVIQYETLNEIFKTTGNLIPDEEVDLSFETSGKITQIYFQEGTAVKKGELLAKVNDKPLQSELKKLEAQIPLATDRVFRQKALLEKDAVSKEAYEQVTTELEKLNADIELTKAKIAQTELRAPFDGIIGLRQVSEGAYASPTTIIARLTKIIPLKVEFSINEKQANDVKKGTNLTFTLGGNLNIYGAQVYAVDPQLELKTRTMKVRAKYPNSNGYLQPGRTASIEIKLQEIKNALTVPSESLILEMGRDIAYLYKNGNAKQVILKKGLRTESKVQILDGIQPGDTLITTGVMQLRDGMPVTISGLKK